MFRSSLLLLLASFCFIFSGCGDSSLPAVPALDPVFTGLRVTSESSTVPLGLLRQFRAYGVLSDGSEREVTATTQWSSADSAIASVNEEGLATGLSPGSTEVRASFAGLSAAAPLRVMDATVVDIEISPLAPSIPSGRRQAFTATARLSDGTTDVITESTTWSTSAPAVAIFQQPAVVTGLTPGETRIQGLYLNLQASTTLTVTEAVLESIVVSPENALTAPGGVRLYTATGTYSDGSTQDITQQVTWSSGDPNVTVENPGGSNLAGRAVVDSQAPTTRDVSIGASLGAVKGQGRLQVGSFLYRFITLTLGPPMNEFIQFTDTLSTPAPQSDHFIVASGRRYVTSAFDSTGLGLFTLVELLNGDSLLLSGWTTLGADGRATLSPAQFVDGVAAGIPAGTNSTAVTVHPSDRYVYVAGGDNTILSFNVLEDGNLETLGTPVPVAASPVDIAVHPTGDYLFALSSMSGSGTLTVFQVQTDGTVQALPNPLTLGTDPRTLDITGDGAYLLLADRAGGVVSRVAVDSQGGLTAAGQVALQATPDTNLALVSALHPLGDALFIVYNDNSSTRVDSFTVAADGQLQLVDSETVGGTSTRYTAAVQGGGETLLLLKDATSSADVQRLAIAADRTLSSLSSLNVFLLQGEYYMTTNP